MLTFPEAAWMVLWDSQLPPPSRRRPQLTAPLAVGAGDPQAGRHPGARQLGPSWPRLPVPPAPWPAGAFPRELAACGLRILRVWVCPLIRESSWGLLGASHCCSCWDSAVDGRKPRPPTAVPAAERGLSFSVHMALPTCPAWSKCFVEHDGLQSR